MVNVTYTNISLQHFSYAEPSLWKQIFIQPAVYTLISKAQTDARCLSISHPTVKANRTISASGLVQAFPFAVASAVVDLAFVDVYHKTTHATK